MLLDEIKSIFTPKGELSGIPFVINYIILFLLCLILNFLGYIFTNRIGEFGQILIFKILTLIFFILSIILMIVLIFNYKRRFLNITNNLAVSIILAIITGFALDFIIAFVYFHPALFIFNRFILPIIIAIIPTKGATFKDYLNLERFKKN